MATYTFEIPHFIINETRAAGNDGLVGAAGLTVRNRFGGLHHRFDAVGNIYGDRGDGSLLASGLMFVEVDVPDPTPDAPDGGSVCWTFTLLNRGDPHTGVLDALKKITDAFGAAVADQKITAVDAGDVGPTSWTSSTRPGS